MAGETGAELVSVTGRSVEMTAEVAKNTMKSFIELLRFFREVRKEKEEKRLRKQTLNDNRLKEERGLVSSNELVKIAGLKKTTLNVLPEKLTRKQQDRFVSYAKAMGIPCSIIMRNDKSEEIKACESRIKELKKNGEELKAAEKEIQQRMTNYCREVEESGGTYSDRVLKDFKNQIAAVKERYENLEFLSDSEKAEYNELQERLNGNPRKGIKGLYNEHQEATIQYLDRDSEIIEYIINQVNAETARENLNSKIAELEEKEKNGTLTADDKDLLNAIKAKDKEIQEQSDKAFNERSKEEIYKDIKNEIERTNETTNFKNAIDHDIKNSTPKVGECTFIYDPDNPNNYVKSIIVEDKNGESDRVVRSYEVYKDGELQSANPIFGTAGEFTDRYTMTVDGQYRFIDKNGKDVEKDKNGRYPKGCKMYWNRLKEDMQEKAGLTNKNLYVLRSEKQFEEVRTAYNEYINEARTVGKNKEEQVLVKPMENAEYDITERIPSLREEIAQISPKLYQCEDKIYNTKEIIDKLGKDGYTYNTADHTFTERASGKKISLESLNEQGIKDMKLNGEYTKLALYYAGTNIENLVEISKSQNEYTDFASKINANIKALEENPDNAKLENIIKEDIGKLHDMADKKQYLIDEVNRNDLKLVNLDIEISNGSIELTNEDRSDVQRIVHDNLDERDINNTNKNLEQWKESAKQAQKAKANEQGGNEHIKDAKMHVNKDR